MFSSNKHLVATPRLRPDWKRKHPLCVCFNLQAHEEVHCVYASICRHMRRFQYLICDHTGNGIGPQIQAFPIPDKKWLNNTQPSNPLTPPFSDSPSTLNPQKKKNMNLYSLVPSYQTHFRFLKGVLIQFRFVFGVIRLAWWLKENGGREKSWVRFSP